MPFQYLTRYLVQEGLGNVRFCVSIVVLTSFVFSGKWFEPRGISYWFVVIVRVRVVFRKTVVGD